MAATRIPKNAVGAGIAVVVGLLLGVASAGVVLYRARAPGEIRVGPWRTSLALGSESAGPYLRAEVAIYNLLALNRSETLYFLASSDSRGAPLRAECSYRITGQSLDARWWSITAYAGDLFLIPNAEGRYSYTMQSLHRDAEGRFTLGLGPKAMDGDWLPSGNGGPISLALRLYNPGANVASAPESAVLPAINPVGACP